MTASPEHKNDSDVVDVTVKSQKGKFEGPFAKTDTVQTVILVSSKKLGFDQSDRFELVLENDRKHPLNPSTVLGTLLKKDDEKKPKLDFVLTATGSGV